MRSIHSHMIAKPQTLFKQHIISQSPAHLPGSSSPLQVFPTWRPHQGVHLNEMEPNSRYTRSSINHQSGTPPTWVSLFKHYLAASSMMITSSILSTFWINNPLPFCSRYWSFIGNTDECYWKPNAFIILAACTVYSSAAFWWYNLHRRWPHQMATIALALIGGITLSLVLKANLEYIMRNTLTWSIFSGLMASAIMDRRKGTVGGGSRV